MRFSSRLGPFMQLAKIWFKYWELSIAMVLIFMGSAVARMLSSRLSILVALLNLLFQLFLLLNDKIEIPELSKSIHGIIYSIHLLWMHSYVPLPLLDLIIDVLFLIFLIFQISLLYCTHSNH